MANLLLIAALLFFLHMLETWYFGFDQAFTDNLQRLNWVQTKFKNPHKFYLVLIGTFVIVWLLTSYLATTGI